VEKRLLDDKGDPKFNVNFYIVNAKGEYAGVSLFAGSLQRESRFAVCTENGPQTLPCTPLIERRIAEEP
jgi:hypothetical protein